MEKKQFFYVLMACFILSNIVYSKQKETLKNKNIDTTMFFGTDPLPVKLNFSNRNVRQNTNDTTYLKTILTYRTPKGWDSIPVKIRARGNYRRKHCYFPPIKMKIKKKEAQQTLFEGNRKFKLVLPCLRRFDDNDNVLKEYLAYKIYELMSPYHLKVRRLDLDFVELKKGKAKPHQLNAFFIEDIKSLANRSNGRVLDRFIHPQMHEAVNATRNTFFQYLIGNTDFANGARHNGKLLFVQKTIIPVPYDFDLSGLVNPSYMFVADVGGKKLPIDKVTDRLYRGFARDPKILQQVRMEFIAKKEQIMGLINDHATVFENTSEFIEARKFVLRFFEIIENDASFRSKILNRTRGDIID